MVMVRVWYSSALFGGSGRKSGRGRRDEVRREEGGGRVQGHEELVHNRNRMDEHGFGTQKNLYNEAAWKERGI